MSTRIRLRRDTNANWTANNPILGIAEVGVVTDAASNSVKLKIGDGVTAWNALSYFAPASAGGTWGSITGTLSDQTDLNTALGLKLNISSFTDAAVTGKVITGFSSGAGVLAGTDSILGAIQKLDGNIGTKQATLVSGTNIKTINGATILGSGDITISTSISDGDKGDITVSSSGTVWTIDNGVVSNAKLLNSAVTIGSTSVSLGGTAATIAGLTLTAPNISGVAVFSASPTVPTPSGSTDVANKSYVDASVATANSVGSKIFLSQNFI